MTPSGDQAYAIFARECSRPMGETCVRLQKIARMIMPTAIIEAAAQHTDHLWPGMTMLKQRDARRNTDQIKATVGRIPSQ